jgi:putative spermidine/putrescine transport system ATP-binding protein
MATVTLAAGATLRLPARGFTAGTDVLLSVRPEQLALSDAPRPDHWPIKPGLSLPIGGQLVHEARTVDGASIKIVEPRLAAPVAAARPYCGLAGDARPSLFPRFT